MDPLENLRVDPQRLQNQLQHLRTTGINVRAQDPAGKWGSFDIADLDDESLACWVNYRLNNEGKLRLIRILLGRESFGDAGEV